MKVNVKEVENEGFKPFKIEIEVETLEELKDLNARVQVSKKHVSNVFVFKEELNDEEYQLSGIVWREYNSRK